MEITMPDSVLDKKIDEAVQKRLEETGVIGRTLDINEFRKKYCGGKSAEWVRQIIFDRYPEVNFDKGGWVVNPRTTAQGRKAIIFESQAAEWIEKHKFEINWNERII